MKCPNCGLLNPVTASRCDCGYDFVAKEVKKSYLPPKELAASPAGRPSLFRSAGFWTAVSTLAVLVRLYYILTDPEMKHPVLFMAGGVVIVAVVYVILDRRSRS